MACTEDRHDPRFVFVGDDEVYTEVVYENDVPTVTETRTQVLECRLCGRRMRGEPFTLTFVPEPASVTMTPYGVEYQYDY